MTESADEILDRVGFDPERTVLTYRQAEVLALRERGLSQAVIADRLGTSRANVSSIESTARENIQKARETVSFAEALLAPVQVHIEAGTSIFDVPGLIYEACDDSGLRVSHTAPELLKRVTDGAQPVVDDRILIEPIVIGVTNAGTVRVRISSDVPSS